MTWFGDTWEDTNRTLGLIAIFILALPLILAAEIMLQYGKGCNDSRTNKKDYHGRS
jgi:hypothetical protein